MPRFLSSRNWSGLPFNVPRVCLAAGCGLLLLPSTAASQAPEPQLYWGDTHLHTSYSIDAYNYGNVIVDPDAAYRFAKGLPVLHPSLDNRVRLSRPLDFLVVADHAIAFGLGAPVEVEDDDERLEAAWPLYVDAADRHNAPGEFTALIGWEWTPTDPANLHRVVFTPAGADAARGFLPFSSSQSLRPEDLWQFLESTSQELGIDFVSVPHNPNLSAGLMFDLVDSDGRPITAEYARTRMRWEPVVEIVQFKGASETHPALSPNDEFANYEIYEALLRGGIATPDPGSYVRTALLRGLEIERDTGENPYKFGFQGATDSHTGLASAEEDNFFGAYAVDTLPAAGSEPITEFWDSVGWDLAAQGLTGAWATQNTREGIVTAFKRKEVYATTGPRITVRVFGGFDFAPLHAGMRDLARIGYELGVPMGGDLANAVESAKVTLLIQAVKDPLGANLDRVQVVKGWLDNDGVARERIYDAAWSPGRSPGSDGALPAVGNTVDTARASYTNAIGSAQLATVWEDPDFDPDQRAFYYVRVLDIPTPRHSTYDAVALGSDPGADGSWETAIQERAYSSPIWYTP